MVDLSVNRSFIAGIELPPKLVDAGSGLSTLDRSSLLRELLAVGTSFKIVGRNGVEIATAPLKLDAATPTGAFADAPNLDKPSALELKDADKDVIADQAQEAFDSAKQQAQVAGASIATFNAGVSAVAREAIADSMKLAKLYADSKFDMDASIDEWFRAYCLVLENTGWAVSSLLLTDYNASGTQLQVHNAILDLLTAAALPGNTLALATALFKALNKMSEDSPWITLFSQQTRRASISQAQFGFVQRADDGKFLTADLVSFRITGMTDHQQILFFKLNTAGVTFKAQTQRALITLDTLLETAPLVRQKIRKTGGKFLSDIIEFSA
jgi:hypothetical protein